jgi:hypothetical protein
MLLSVPAICVTVVTMLSNHASLLRYLEQGWHESPYCINCFSTRGWSTANLAISNNSTVRSVHAVCQILLEFLSLGNSEAPNAGCLGQVSSCSSQWWFNLVLDSGAQSWTVYWWFAKRCVFCTVYRSVYREVVYGLQSFSSDKFWESTSKSSANVASSLFPSSQFIITLHHATSWRKPNEISNREILFQGLEVSCTALHSYLCNLPRKMPKQ